jgi:hypothetical protein
MFGVNYLFTFVTYYRIDSKLKVIAIPALLQHLPDLTGTIIFDGIGKKVNGPILLTKKNYGY